MVSNPPFISNLGHLEGDQPYLRDLLTMVINRLVTGMILQVGSPLDLGENLATSCEGGVQRGTNTSGRYWKGGIRLNL